MSAVTDYNTLRMQVWQAACEGRATYRPAQENNLYGSSPAQIFIDGQLVGDAKTVGYYVSPVTRDPYLETKLAPRTDFATAIAVAKYRETS